MGDRWINQQYRWFIFLKFPNQSEKIKVMYVRHF